MDLLSIIILAIGLAMDCLAVSISKGICAQRFQVRGCLLMALLFGLFQAAMPLIGYFAGISFTNAITRIDHWIALVLLSFIGGRMIWESFKKKDSAETCRTNEYAFAALLPLAVATSIDALATGIIFVPTPQWIWPAVTIIGLTSFLLSLAGSLIGCRFGNKFNINVELVGGIILIAIGLKIWIEHMFF